MQDNPSKYRNRKNKKWQPFGYSPWFILFLCSTVFSLAWLYGSMENKSRPKNRNDFFYKSTAQFSCEDFVKAKLKSPSSAVFSPYSELIIQGSAEGPWTVSGYVDAQNSFGAQIRNRFDCSVQFNGDKVQLLRLSLN